MEISSAALNPIIVRQLVESWLVEDAPGLDFAGVVVGDAACEAVLFAKSMGVLAGVPFFNAVFQQLQCTVEWLDGAVDGIEVRLLQRVAVVRGSARALLRGERVALNCLCRASGIATLARDAVRRARSTSTAPWRGRVAGTRKTTPGFRLVEKYALLVGGADTHRYDLGSMVMLKDNHVWSVGDISKAIGQCRDISGFSLKLEVECRTEQEALEAASAGSDVVMLDNFTPETAASVSQKIKAKYPAVTVEVSGGITLDNIHEFAVPHVDVISMGQLTQGYPCLDFSLKVLRGSKGPVVQE